MDSTGVTALAAAIGSLVGASASIGTTWISQRRQSIRATAEWKLRERESLYKEFIMEASRLFGDAMVNSLDRPDQLVALYGILSRIRLISGGRRAEQGGGLLPPNCRTLSPAKHDGRADSRRI